MKKSKYFDKDILDNVLNFDIKADSRGGKKAAVIDLNGAIGFDFEAMKQGDSPYRNTFHEIRDQVIDAMKGGAEELIINISAETGDSRAAVELYEFFAAQTVPVTTYCYGYCGTHAIMVAQAGDNRQASESTMFTLIPDNEVLIGSMNQNTIRQVVADLRERDKHIATFLSHHSRKNDRYFASEMAKNPKATHWHRADDFLETGLIDKLKAPKKGKKDNLQATNVKTAKPSRVQNTKADRKRHARTLELLKIKNSGSAADKKKKKEFEPHSRTLKLLKIKSAALSKK